MSEPQSLRAIVELLPRYLQARRVGSSLPSDATGPVEIPDYVLLRAIAAELDDEPISYDQLRANVFNPYNIVRPVLDRVPRLVECGLLQVQDGHYALAPAGRELLIRGERAANDYAAGRMRLPPDELERLSLTLSDIAERLLRAPEPADKAHQARLPRLRRFDDRQTPPVQLEYALYALWMARDDAHNAAWRAKGFRGPPFDLLSRVWAGDASTIAELVEQTRDSMHPEDVEALLDQLERDRYVTITWPNVALTGRGREVRDAIETETDRVYFAPWPALDAEWVRGRLETLVAGLHS